MRLLLSLSLLFVTQLATAGENVECAHHHGAIRCKFNEDMILVDATINGGECPVPPFRHYAKAGSKFIIPGSKECYYCRSLTLTTSEGKTYRFIGM